MDRYKTLEFFEKNKEFFESTVNENIEKYRKGNMTVSVIDEKKNYIGGMILPGMRVALDALTSRASQLSGISLDVPKRVIGKNTIDCMKSGVLYSNAGALDGIIERMEEELGQKTTVVATGGLAKKVVPLCKKDIILDEDLLLKGLLVIYQKNK